MTPSKVTGLIVALLLSVLSRAHANEGYTWSSMAIGGGGFVSAIIPSTREAGLLYARTDVGGAYRWDAASERWIPLNDWVSDEQTGYLGVESLALDPNAPGKVYMLVGISYFNSGRTAILRSDDYGQTFDVIDTTAQFRAHGNGMGRQTGEKLQVDPNNGNILYVGTRAHGLFKSTDAGSTWHRVDALPVTTTPNENGISFVLLDPASAADGATQRMIIGVSRYAAAGVNLYRSDDGGRTFAAIAGAPVAHMPQRAVLASDGHAYITYANGAGPHGHWQASLDEPMDAGQVWKYNLGTGAWTPVTPAGFARAFSGISVDPDNPQRLVLSSINTYQLQYAGAYGDRLFLSTNGGASWTDLVARGFVLDNQGVPWINGHAIHWAGSIAFNPFNTQEVWVTSGNGVFRNGAVDSGNTWAFTVAGLEETVPLGLVSIPGGPVVSVIGDYDGFLHDSATRYGQVHTPRMGTTTGLAMAAQNTDMLVRVGDQMYYTLNQGATWTRTQTMNGSKGQVAVLADGSALIHSPENTATSYRSTNLGNSWTAVAGLSVSNAHPVADPVNASKVYAYNPGGHLLVSTNGGASFSAAGSLAANGSRVIAVAPGREGDVWVALYNGGLARSTDSGGSFTALARVGYAAAVGFGKAAEGGDYPVVYLWGSVDGVRGLHRSTDQGASWVRINDDRHQFGGPGNGQFVVGDMNTFGVVYLSTAGRGIAYGYPSGEPASSSSTPSSSSSSSSSVSSDEGSASSVSSRSSAAGNTGGGSGGGHPAGFLLSLLCLVGLGRLQGRRPAA